MYLASMLSDEPFIQRDGPIEIKDTPPPSEHPVEVLHRQDRGDTEVGQRSSPEDSDPEFDELLRSFGKHPEQIQQFKESRTIDCVVCSNDGGPGGSLSETIQCSKCFLCSHWKCIKLHFGPGKRTLAMEESWKCPGRCNPNVPLWDDNL